MSTESQESVATDGQALLERVLALERALSRDQGPQQSDPPSSQAGPSGTSAPPSSTPSASGDSGEYECGLSQLAAKRRQDLLRNYIKLTSQWVSEFNDRLSYQHNPPTAAISGGMKDWLAA